MAVNKHRKRILIDFKNGKKSLLPTAYQSNNSYNFYVK